MEVFLGVVIASDIGSSGIFLCPFTVWLCEASIVQECQDCFSGSGMSVGTSGKNVTGAPVKLVPEAHALAALKI